MRVDIEKIKAIKEELRIINDEELDKIHFFENGIEVEVNPRLRDDFIFCGLCNVDFITTGYYKNEC